MSGFEGHVAYGGGEEGKDPQGSCKMGECQLGGMGWGSERASSLPKVTQ